MTPIGDNGGPPLDDDASPFGREGYVRVYRAMRDHPVIGFGRPVKPADSERGSHSRAEAWLDLIMECRYALGTINNKGRIMQLKPGQLLGAVSWLAHRWNWTPKTVRGFLDQLQDQAMLEKEVPGQKVTDRPATEPGLNEIQTGNRKGKFAQVLTISNYSIFQIVEGMKGQVERQDEGKSRASRGQVEGNNLRREEGKKGIIEEESVSESREAPPIQPIIPKPALEGEHVGHGVWVSSDTIRHLGFSISLPAIHLATIASGLPKDEIKTRCLAHALQWGAEIEGGRSAQLVVPSKIANFLGASIMSEVMKAATQTVRIAKAKEGYSRIPVNPDKPGETQSERLARLADDMDREKTRRTSQ